MIVFFGSREKRTITDFQLTRHSRRRHRRRVVVGGARDESDRRRIFRNIIDFFAIFFIRRNDIAVTWRDRTWTRSSQQLVLGSKNLRTIDQLGLDPLRAEPELGPPSKLPTSFPIFLSELITDLIR